MLITDAGAQHHRQFPAGIQFAEIEEAQVLLRHGQSNLGQIDGERARELRADVHVLADIGELLAHHAVVGGADDGPPQVFLDFFQFGLFRFQFGQRLLQLRLAQCEFRCRSGRGVEFAQAFPVFERVSGQRVFGGDSGTSLCHLGAGAFHHRLVVARIDADQHVSPRKKSTAHEGGRHFGDLARHLGHQRRLRARRHQPPGPDDELYGRPPGGRYGHQQCGFGNGFLRRFRTGLDHGERCHHRRDDERHRQDDLEQARHGKVAVSRRGSLGGQ